MNNPYDIYTLYGGNKRDVLGKASNTSRFAALLLDNFILTMLILPPLLFFLFRNMDAIPTRLFVWSFPMLIPMFVFMLKDIVKGRSPGKWVLGIAVRERADTAKTPSVGKLILRNLLMFFLPIEVLVLVSGEKKLKIGDRLAGTDVYRVPSRLKARFVVIGIILIFALYIGTLVFGVMGVLRTHPSFEAATSFIETHPEVIELVGEVESQTLRSGSVSHSGGYGQAEYVIRVRGSEHTIYIQIHLARPPGGEWEVVWARS